ncbi:MAG: response regulator [Rhodocyclaceae bacterium]
MAKTIMVIDDSSSMRQIVGMALKGAGYDVVDACDGRDALGKLPAQKVHLIICDLNMPNMDGLSFVRQVKQSADHRFTPVIMLTTEAEESKKKEGQAAGARAWIVKPFQPATMVAAVQKLCA